MKRRKRRNRGGRRRSGNWRWWLLLTLAILVICIGAYFLFDLRKSLELDDDLCPMNEPATAILFALFDLSDPINVSQAARLRTEFYRQVDSLNPGTKISVGVVTSELDELGPRFIKCKPLKGKEANRIYQNPSLVEERFQNEFRQPLDGIIEKLMNAEEQETSPIIESMHALVAETRGSRDPGISKSLMLVSDLLQNSSHHSFFRGEHWESFLESGNASKVSSALEDFDVTIIRIPGRRAAKSDPRLVDDFWVRYLEAQGIRSLDVDLTTLGEF